MESAIQTLVKVFLKSTKGKESLGKKEFQHLVKGQLSNILSDTDSKEAVNNMGQGLDADHDGKVGFEEYMKLVGYLACSLSEQRNVANQDPTQNADPTPATQTALDKEEGKPAANAEAKAEAKEEAKPEAAAGAKVEVGLPDLKANAEPKIDVKLDANAAPKVEVNLDAAEPKIEVKAEGAAESEAPKADEEKTAAVTVAAAVEAAVEEAASTVEEVVKEGEKETEKVVAEVGDKVAEAVEEVKEKTEEATS